MNKQNNFKKIFLHTLSAIFLILIISGCNDYTVRNDGNLDNIADKTFNTTPGKNFELKASFGDVYVITSDSPTVKVRILGNSETIKKVRFEYDNSEDGVTVIAEKKDKWNFFNFWNHMKLKFEITLPRTYNVSIASSGGDLYLKDLDGKINLHTSGGDIELAKSIGTLSAKTSGGDINIDGFDGDVKIGTSGGDVTALACSGNLDASTSGGDIKLEAANGKIHASTSGGEVSLKYVGENKGIELYSSGGDIRASLPANFNADAKLHSSGGSVNCNFKTFDVQEMSSHKLVGTFNNGGLPLVIRTSGGDIDVK